MSDQISYEVWLDEKNQIIRQRLEGPIDEDASQKIVALTEALKAKLHDPTKVKLLVVSERTSKPTPGARRSLLEVALREDFYKMAVLGHNPYMKVFLSFFLMVSGLHKIKAFAKEEDALEWLGVSK